MHQLSRRTLRLKLRDGGQKDRRETAVAHQCWHVSRNAEPRPIRREVSGDETFDEAGWEHEAKTWSSRYGHHDRNEPLHEFLAIVLRVPPEEAAALAAEVEHAWFSEYKARGGEHENRKVERFATVVFAALVGVVVFAAIGLVLTVWLIAR